MKYVDLRFLGRPGVIATVVLEGPSGLLLIDPGPASCLHALEAGLDDLGLRLKDVRTLLLTHIHLDHAGGTGTLLDQLPAAHAYVHERGAPHMIEPTKLLQSAARLYGDAMDRLWGEMRPVPAGRLHVLKGGEQLDLAGRTFQVAYTPGHASHHVSFLETSSGVAYVGDTAGIRKMHDYILAPTPPPDIDLDAWEQSLRRIETWRPSTLFLTHFGPVTDPATHLQRLRVTLDRSARRVKATLDMEGTDEERTERFVEELRAEVRLSMPEEDAKAMELSAPFAQLWQGLARYWRRKAAVPSA